MALYRTYRPASFAEVVGQGHVTGPLSTALNAGRINHAYLFSGPRGCGKTSSARILARSLNCVEGPTATPCGQCPSCVALAPGGPGNLDVTELDAASHGGVEDARELRDQAFFAPAQSRYRVFIIDEAHMVTTQGFNALLKIVEEPPEHLIFIFATTEPEKVLGTIRSRTHHYPFRLLPPATMRGLLARICAAEQVQLDDAVASLVIRAGGGSPRDTLSVLDQLLAGADAGGVSYANALALLGATDVSLLDAAVVALAASDGGALFGVVHSLIEAGHDPRRFTIDLLDRLRDLILLKAVPDAGARGLVDAPPELLGRLAEQAEGFGPATLARFAEVVSAGLTEMRGATAPRLLLEVICARMLLPSASTAESALLQRLEALESHSPAPAAGRAVEAPAKTDPPQPVQPRTAQASPQVPSVAAAERQPRDVPQAPDAAENQKAQFRRPSTQPPTAQQAGSQPAGSRPAGGQRASAQAAGDQPPRAERGGAQQARGQGPSAQQSGPTVQDASAQGASVQPPEASAPEPQQPAGGPGADMSAAVEQVRRRWPQVRAALRAAPRGTTLDAMLGGATVVGIEGALLLLSHDNAGLADRFNEPRSAAAIRDAVHSVFPQLNEVRITVSGARSTQRAQAAKSQPRPSSPAKQFSRPSRAAAPQEAPAAPRPDRSRTASPSAAEASRATPPVRRGQRTPEEIPPPEEPYPDDEAPPDPMSVSQADEEEMLAESAHPAPAGQRRDPDDEALELLQSMLGARPLDS